jgi:uncharacterized protein YjgD (DUF1641 family)
MSDPLLIALFALVGSALGGFASPILLRLLDRRYTHQDRADQIAEARAEKVHAALSNMSEILTAWTLALNSGKDTDDHYLHLIAAHQQVQLLIGKEDAALANALAERLSTIVSADTPRSDRARMIGAFNSALVVWFRGESATDIVKLLRDPDMQ